MWCMFPLQIKKNQTENSQNKKKIRKRKKKNKKKKKKKKNKKKRKQQKTKKTTTRYNKDINNIINLNNKSFLRCEEIIILVLI